jgi:hypothetical protein
MRSRSSITWITSLSLDAPLVVAVWQHAIAVHYCVTLNVHHRILVFLAVWLGYTADRWLDAWRHKTNVTHRHAFHALRRWTLLSLWLLILGLSITISFAKLSSSELRSGLTLAFVSMAITGIIQLDRFGKWKALIKSAFTAFLVTSSVLIFSLPISENRALEAFSVMLPLFFLNCVFIHSWDSAIDAKQSPSGRNTCNRSTILIACVLTFGLSFYWLGNSPLAWYAISSALNLVAIHLCLQSLNLETKRTLADLALLTPLVVFI